MNTITLPRSVVEQALEALEKADRISGYRNNWAEVNSLIAALEQPQGEQETVAYYVMNGAALFQLFRSKSQADALAYDLQKRHDLSGSLAHFHVVPLYIRPQPPRQPLTEERIDALRLATGYAADLQRFTNIVRTLERAHGIGGDA